LNAESRLEGPRMTRLFRDGKPAIFAASGCGAEI
jgi:hypothetical protein